MAQTSANSRQQRRPTTDPAVADAFLSAGAHVHDTELVNEMETSYLAYSMSVIHARALPDARDGLKPVHRRILFSMHESGLRPDHSYVKSARVVGECFPAGALVSTPGGLRAIETLNVGDKVLDPDGNPVAIVECYENPPGEMLRIVSTSAEIDATPGQLFRVVNDDYSTEWVEARNLNGRRIVFLGRSGVGSECSESDDEMAYMFGLLGAEGSCEANQAGSKSRRVSIAMTDEEPIRALATWADRRGYEYTLSDIAAKRDDWKRKIGLRFRSRHTPELITAVNNLQWMRTVPSSILEHRDTWVPFLAGYIDGDGYISPKKGLLHIASTSRQALNQMQAMLSSLGITTGIYCQQRPAESKHHDLYTLEAYGDNARRLALLISPYLLIAEKRAKAETIARRTPITNVRREGLPGRAMLNEFTRLHLGAGWYKDTEGRKFRQSMDSDGFIFRHGRSSSGVDFRDALYGIETMHSRGWVEKLRRIGSPLADRLDALRGFTFQEVTSVTRIADAPNFDIQVDSDEHAFIVNGAVVHNCMGRYHPHGDTAIYDALARMAQPFSLNTPLIDGHGNFGSPDYGPAAMRYTEARLTPMAMHLVGEISEDTVVMTPTYDGSATEPSVLPAAFPNLLVNGSTGIAVGMSTNMPPHNLNEVIAAARLLIANPNATLDDLMAVLPGPDLPTGGLVLGADGIREAYETGAGKVRIRARATTGPVEGGRGRSAITVAELPYGVGPEKVIEAIKKEMSVKRLAGIADVKDLSDRVHGLRLVIEVKTGVNADVVLAELFQRTPMELNFSIQNLALVEGQPRQLGLHELLMVFLNHRYDVVTRRTQYRLAKAEARLHIVDGLLIALANIDEVVRIIRAAQDTAIARKNLITAFNLSDIQAGHILDMPLRRLVRLEVTTLKDEAATLKGTIRELKRILGSSKALRAVVDDELDAIATANPSPRRSTLVDGDLATILEASKPQAPREVANEPTQVLLSTTGMLARTPVPTESLTAGRRHRATGNRTRHDAITAVIDTTTHANVILLTNKGRGLRIPTLAIPPLPASGGQITLKAGTQVRELVALEPGEHVLGLAPGTDDGGVVAVITRAGVVKTVVPDWPVRSDAFTLIGLKPDDAVVTATWVPNSDTNREFVIVSTTANLLRFPVEKVRPQGLSGGGVAGIALPEGVTVAGAATVNPDDDPFVITTTSASTKVTPLAEYPGKGRATGGVRCQKFLKGETHLTAAAITDVPAAAASNGDPVDLPAVDQRRDSSGTKHAGFGAVGFLVEDSN